MDSNVLLDVFTVDPEWFPWSSSRLAAAADDAKLVVNPLIYAEVAAHFSRIEALDEALPAEVFSREPLPWTAGFLAAHAHAGYRRRGGARDRTLPEFYIGAHAAIAGHRLLTRDPRRYRAAFPSVDLIAP